MNFLLDDDEELETNIGGDKTRPETEEPPPGTNTGNT